MQGPPGTGKTTTIVAALSVLYAKHIRTLVCSSTNRVVEVISRKIFKGGLLGVTRDEKIYPVGSKYYTYDNNSDNAASSSVNNKIYRNESLFGILFAPITSCYIINLCIVTIVGRAESLDFSGGLEFIVVDKMLEAIIGICEDLKELAKQYLHIKVDYVRTVVYGHFLITEYI